MRFGSPAAVEDRRRLQGRIAILRAGVAAAFTLLLCGFWYFQVLQYAKFREMAENNHQRTLPLRAPRGVIFDRHGEVLVENRAAFNISIMREHSRDLDHTIRLLSAVTGVSESAMRETVDRHRREPAYQPIVVVQDATLAQVAAVTARRLDFELPDVVVQEVPTRSYPAEALGAHLLGYVGEVSEQMVAEAGIASGTVVGQSGLERTYNDMLMGQDGARRVVVNSVGREIRTLDETPPVEGRRLQLTLDASMQRAAEQGFKVTGYWGSAVVLDPRSGDVLTLVSLPAYDPNAFAGGIDRETWQQLNTDELRPLQNRAIQGRYSPGSTFKIVVATAGLEEGVITPDFKVFCGGGATFYGRFFQCLGHHGWVDVRHALEKSCNTFFYTVGNMLGVDRIHEWSERLGLASKSGVDLPNEVESIIPSTAWKQQRTGERWYPGETISVAIGQGQVSVTPMSMAVMMASVARGARVTPRLVKATSTGGPWQQAPPSAAASAVTLKAETVSAVHDGLWMAVNGAGTAVRAKIAGRDVAGKTGTAQVISLQGRQRARGNGRDYRDHGWFVFMVPADDPELAGVIFAEHSEHGYLAAPIARHIIETYYARKEGRPAPVMPPVPGTPGFAPPPPPPTRTAGPGDAEAAGAGQR
ncbi:MAG: penicillin-binding protein 2 [Vicinamibacterales bacterium]